MQLKRVGYNVNIWPMAKIISPETVSIGHDVIIDDFVFLMGGKRTDIGNYVHIASFVSITGGGEFDMGDFSGLSSGVRVFTGHEDYKGSKLTNPTVPEPYRHAHRTFVKIGKHAVVGANTVILAGVTIGEGAAIGAGSVVLKDCKPWTVYAGVPAKEISKREKETILKLEKALLSEKKDIMVSISCLTYNHAHLIRQALDSFMMQKADFKFEIVIHDDASTDGTADIIRDYEKKFPKIVKGIYQTENQFKKNGVYPVAFIYPHLKGKYVAECDGDDYWTDPLKLQKQVDFMEKNIDCVMTHHAYKIWTNGTMSEPSNLPPKDYTQDELIACSLKDYGIAHCTKMWRNLYNNSTKKDFENFIGDYPLNVLMGTYGPCKFVQGIEPSIYCRMHGSNSWCNLPATEMKRQTVNMYHRMYELMVEKGNRHYMELRRPFLFEDKPKPETIPPNPPRTTPSIIKPLGVRGRPANWR